MNMSWRIKRENALIIFILIVTFSLLFMFRATQQTGDSLNYSLSAKTSQQMFHPHHLLYTPIIHLCYSAITLICKSCDVIMAAQIHNIVLTVLAILSYYFILRLVLRFQIVFAVPLTSLLFISQGILVYSTQVEVYVPATACLVLLVLIISTHTVLNKFPTMMIIVISLLLAMAIFYHQTNVLFFIPMIYYFMSIKREQKLFKLLKIILFSSGMIVLSGYILAFLSITSTPTIMDFLRFCFRYTLHPDPNWGSFAHFSPFGVQQLFNSQLWNIVELPMIFRYIAAILIVILLILNLVKAFKSGDYYKFRRFLLIWVITYYIFFLWWLPGEKEFFITTLIPFWLLFCLSIRDLFDKIKEGKYIKKITLCGLVVLVICIALMNSTKVMSLHDNLGSSYYYASRMDNLIPKECVIFADWTTQNNLKYFFGRNKVVTADHPILSFYTKKPSLATYSLEDEHCVVVPLQYIIPEYSIAGCNGYTCPSEWLEYIEWIFGVDDASEQKKLSCREFLFLQDTNKELYISFSNSSRIEIKNLRVLFEVIDAKMNIYLDKETDLFRQWVTKNLKLGS